MAVLSETEAVLTSGNCAGDWGRGAWLGGWSVLQAWCGGRGRGEVARNNAGDGRVLEDGGRLDKEEVRLCNCGKQWWWCWEAGAYCRRGVGGVAVANLRGGG